MNPDCASAVDGWYNELSQYDFGSPGFSDATGHFTQLVWQATTSIGCAFAAGDLVDSSGVSSPTIFVVCEYDPPGNYAGEFETNVLPA